MRVCLPTVGLFNCRGFSFTVPRGGKICTRFYGFLFYRRESSGGSFQSWVRSHQGSFGVSTLCLVFPRFVRCGFGRRPAGPAGHEFFAFSSRLAFWTTPSASARLDQQATGAQAQCLWEITAIYYGRPFPHFRWRVRAQSRATCGRPGLPL